MKRPGQHRAAGGVLRHGSLHRVGPGSDLPGGQGPFLGGFDDATRLDGISCQSMGNAESRADAVEFCLGKAHGNDYLVHR